MSGFISVYVTFPNKEEAEMVARILVEEKLAACVNIVPEIKSIYIWEGADAEDAEAAFFAKTTADNFEKLEKRVKELHSYTTPCIVAFPILMGNQAYLEWVKKGSSASNL